MSVKIYCSKQDVEIHSEEFCRAQQTSATMMAESSSLSDTLRIEYSSIEALIRNSICRGYLLQFCESEYNSENLNFVSEVIRLRDNFFAVDKSLWSKDWRDTDKTVATNERRGFKTTNWKKNKWPSELDITDAQSHIERIMEEYVLDHSKSQVCISGQFFKNLKKRINLIHLYGPHIFEEACIDPIKTMKKDVLPRFLTSEIFRTMIKSLVALEPLPPGCDLFVPCMTKLHMIDNPLEYFTDDREFTLGQLITDETLYIYFRVFLEQNHCSENLLCVRMIDNFEKLKTAGEDKRAEENAWIIYKYFVAPGSAFEVSTLALDRKNLMKQLAQPRGGMFQKVRHSSYTVLRANFELFENSVEFRKLGKIMRYNKIQFDKTEGRCRSRSLPSSEVGCFAMSEIWESRSRASSRASQKLLDE
jgi:hypothetical protein